jgi:hypothetical protein
MYLSSPPYVLHIIKLFVIYSSPLHIHFGPLRPKYLPGYSVSKDLTPGCSINVCDQVSHPYKATGKIIVPYMLVFPTLDRKVENKIFCTEK